MEAPAAKPQPRVRRETIKWVATWGVVALLIVIMINISLENKKYNDAIKAHCASGLIGKKLVSVRPVLYKNHCIPATPPAQP